MFIDVVFQYIHGVFDNTMTREHLSNFSYQQSLFLVEIPNTLMPSVIYHL